MALSLFPDPCCRVSVHSCAFLSSTANPVKKEGDNNVGTRGTYIFTWGAGYHGQLGRKFVRGKLLFASLLFVSSLCSSTHCCSLFLLRLNTKYGVLPLFPGEKKYSDIPLAIPLDEVVCQVACGGLHTAIVTETGRVYTWGDSRSGQLGQSRDPSVKQIPHLVEKLLPHFVVQIACGSKHTLCLTDKGSAYSWGFAKYGQIGHGDRQNLKEPRLISCDSAKNVKHVYCGDHHTVLLNGDGQAFAFGSAGMTRWMDGWADG